ncbi:MAG: phosphoserine aminotransferase [Pseudomonadota bacterium]|nr:phosphoserine aminotransferase [Pseudomonadota bacterium]
MKIPRIRKPEDPRFSSGPTKKPEGWSLNKINTNFLGRYHRSKDVKEFIENKLNRIRKILKIPEQFKIFLTPGSCTGATEAVIWSLLGDRKITSIIYDYWGLTWYKDLKKLNYDIDCRISLDGSIPILEDIPLFNDILFVWTGTTTGISVNNLDFLEINHDGLIICDITSAVFIYDLPWDKIDVSTFSWQKALGSESQHGIVVMSPKAISRLKEKLVPKVFDLFKYNDFINTPSLLAISDLALCLDLYEKRGGLKGNIRICRENKSIISLWEQKSDFVNMFSKDKKYEALSPTYMVFKEKFDYQRLFKFLDKNKIAYDIKNYRMAEPGIRVWSGPTIKKNDLIALTNWLDWCFKNLLM